ncbi:MAG: FkbM family methyltransferase [Verrucomicrobia bacterium]|nr:FkbM family methyltransferase [Verrucomicrobiota bacterium]
MIEFLKVLRKTFLTRARDQHYSQHGEDCVLRHWIPREKKGFYVDVGCYHPKKGSNTYFLYRRGWRGVNVDLDSYKILSFRLARPHDINVVAAVSDHVGHATVHSDKWYSCRATISAVPATNDLCEVRDVQTTTLNTILDATPYRNRGIDLLNVDVEGLDLHVLRGLDFDRYRPELILIENHVGDLTQLLGTELHQFLSTRHYTLVNWVGCTLFYRRQAERVAT